MNSIKHMLGYVEEYEQVKAKQHKDFKTAREFFSANRICFQNFYKFYNRYIAANRDPQALLPTRRGPKPKYCELPGDYDELVHKVLEFRQKGFNKFLISQALIQEGKFKKSCSPSTVYRILKKHGESRLRQSVKEEKRMIIRDSPGSLGHIDCHTLPRGIVRSEPGKRYHVLGCIDDYSRVCWVEVTDSLKAIDACFAMMDVILIMNQRYGITFREVMTDNGSEFCGGQKSLMQHPFERLLMHFNIMHRRTKPYRPQTNGKIERFWKTFEDEAIEGASFETLEELKDAVLGYNFYYNETRPHQGIGGKTPQSMTNDEAKRG
jgi:transposase InsO family protein